MFYLQFGLWFSNFEYLIEIFTHLNSVTTNMLGRDENALTSVNKMNEKIGINVEIKRAEFSNFEMFPYIRKI